MLPSLTRRLGRLVPSWLIVAIVCLFLLVGYGVKLRFESSKNVEALPEIQSPVRSHQEEIDIELEPPVDHADHQLQQLEERVAGENLPAPKHDVITRPGQKCPPKYGKVVIFVAVVTSSYKRFYQVAQASLRCYLTGVDYEFKLIDLDTDKRVAENCKHTQLFFKKHCAASLYLEDADWMLVLDADTGVVNPNHCIEEYIDERVDIIFYERFFNWEIASGNYLVRNTPFAKDFLRRWADWQYNQPASFSGADNGVLQVLILETVMPESVQAAELCKKLWREGFKYETYMRYVTCVRWALGAKRMWPGKLKLLRRAQGWVRDGFITNDHWCEKDFMLHGWKANSTGVGGWQSPFMSKPSVEECEKEGEKGFHWRDSHRRTTDQIKLMLANIERDFAAHFPTEANNMPFISVADIRTCWPECDEV